MRFNLAIPFLLASATFAVVASAQVPAQQSAAAPDEVGGVQEVVVTAQRRSESQLSVPMSISVVPAQQLKDQSVQVFNDFAQEIPNLTFAGAGGGLGDVNARSVAIRGIQGANVTGYYLDDLPMPISLDPRVLDLERIEVLRGPQGTLYGARSMGGTVREVTTAPDLNQVTSQVHAEGTSIDGGGNGYQVDGTFNVPLIPEKLALRFTPFTGEDPGYINRVYASPAGSSNQVEVKNTAAAKYEGFFASVLWKATDALTIRPTYMYQSTNTNGFPLADYNASNLTNYRAEDVPEGYTDTWYYTGGSINYATPVGVFTSVTSVLNRSTSDREDISEWAAATFGAPVVPFYSGVTGAYHSTTEEIRFASGWNGPLQFVGGLYFDSESSTFLEVQNIPSYEALFGSSMAYNSWDPNNTKERAAYGELTYSITSQWSATVGGRYSKDKTTTGGYQWGLADGAPTFADATPNNSSSSDKAFTPKFLVKYEPNGDMNFYADAAKGYRPGSGEVPPPPAFCAANYQAVGLTPAELSSYQPDSVWSYEIGAKMRTLDRRVSITGAVFWIDWKNIQESINLSQCGFSAVLNTAAARSRGGELEVSANPMDHLSLNAAMGYTDAVIVSGGLATFLKPGETLPEVAPWTASFNAQYEQPLFSNTSLVFRVDYSYTDHSYSIANSELDPRVRPSYELVNLRTALRQGPIEYALFVKNLADAHPNLGDQISGGAEFQGRPRWDTGPPRTYGIEFRAKF
jgi:iron complex outermembrane receptor protein